MFIQAKRAQLVLGIAALVSGALTFLSCSDSAGPTAQRAGALRERPLRNMDYHRSPTGLEAYKALFQGRGALADEVSFIHDNYSASLFIPDHEADSIYTVVSDEMIDAINDVDPTFFSDFTVAIQSGDPLTVQAGLQRASTTTLHATVTLPGFQEAMESGAENDTLLAAAVAAIQDADPESEVSEEDVSVLLTQLSNAASSVDVVIPPLPYIAPYYYLPCPPEGCPYNNVYVNLVTRIQVWMDAYRWSGIYVPGKHRDIDEENFTLGTDTLTNEMLIGYIVEYWYNPTPDS